jgi:hypothetical protein
LTSSGQNNAQNLPPSQTFNGSTRTGNHVFGIGCSASKDKVAIALANAMTECIDAGYVDCKPVENTAAAGNDDYGNCTVSISVIGVNNN